MAQFMQMRSWTAVFIGFLVLSLLIYGGFLGYKNYLDQDIGNLQKTIDELSSQRDRGLEKNIQLLAKQAGNIKTILKNHFYWSKLFAVFERLVGSQVYFLSFGGKVDSGGAGAISLEGRTIRYGEAAKELRLFLDEPFFKDVKISTVNLDEGAVHFSVNIDFDTEKLKGK